MKHTRESLEKMHALELLDAAKLCDLINLAELKPLNAWADNCIAEVERRELRELFRICLTRPCDGDFWLIRRARDDRQVIIAAILCAQEGVEK